MSWITATVNGHNSVEYRLRAEKYKFSMKADIQIEQEIIEDGSKWCGLHTASIGGSEKFNSLDPGKSYVEVILQAYFSNWF